MEVLHNQHKKHRRYRVTLFEAPLGLQKLTVVAIQVTSIRNRLDTNHDPGDELVGKIHFPHDIFKGFPL